MNDLTPPPTQQPPQDNQAPQKRIILVEDEEPIRALYKRQLEHANYTIDAFETGAEAIAAFEQKPYDIMLLDVMLPDTNGIDILKTLTQKGLIQKCPIVLLTNLAQDNIIKEGFSLGVTGYMIKAQHTPQQIVTEVNKFLEQKA